MKRLLGIIGDPVDHSLSPVMHHAGFQASGIDAEYLRIPIPMSALSTHLPLLRAGDYLGWNVTYPLKEAIIPYLDQLTPEASSIGAVNTVKVANGLLIGHNTDGLGFIAFLRSIGFEPMNKKVVILGAGGSARAIAVSLAKVGADLLILNRSSEHAEVLCRLVKTHGKCAFGPLENGDWLKEIELLIQTTPIGMKNEPYPFDLKGIRAGSLAVDLIYHPLRTSFLTQASQYSCDIRNGLGMLAYQGALAWEFWFDRKAPIAEMLKALPGYEEC